MAKPIPVPTLTAADIERFNHSLRRDKSTGCLLWTGTKSSAGYGVFKVNKRAYRAHRVAFATSGRSLTCDKPLVLHDCPCGDNPACCEPTHLWAGSDADNLKDMARKGRSHKSPAGFPFGTRPNGKASFMSRARINGKFRYFGTFQTWQEAAATAMYEKNLALYPDTTVN